MRFTNSSCLLIKTHTQTHKLVHKCPNSHTLYLPSHLTIPPPPPYLVPASPSYTRGVLHYAVDWAGLEELMEDGPHAPYVVLMEPELFNNRCSTAMSCLVENIQPAHKHAKYMYALGIICGLFTPDWNVL